MMSGHQDSFWQNPDSILWPHLNECWENGWGKNNPEDWSDHEIEGCGHLQGDDSSLLPRWVMDGLD